MHSLTGLLLYLSIHVVMSFYSLRLPIGGAPLGYFDWPMIGQLLTNGAESAAMFVATAAAMDYCMERGYISKFP
jgi:hypothetical protein